MIPIPVTSGVKLGCLLSPTSFNLFINGLIEEIMKLGLGVKCGESYDGLRGRVWGFKPTQSYKPSKTKHF